MEIALDDIVDAVRLSTGVHWLVMTSDGDTHVIETSDDEVVMARLQSAGGYAASA